MENVIIVLVGCLTAVFIVKNTIKCAKSIMNGDVNKGNKQILKEMFLSL